MESLPPGSSSSPLRPELSDAEAKLVEEHDYLAGAITRKLKRLLPAHVDGKDLEAYGRIGLVQSARRFDPSRGVLFKTFAYYRVRGAILDGIQKMAWFRRQPVRQIKALSSTNDFLADAADRAASEPPTAELPGLLEQAAELVGGIIASQMISLSEEESPEVMDSEADASREAERVVLARTVQKLIGRLEPAEQSIVQLYYFQGLTLEASGEKMGLSKSWTSRLHARALKKLFRLATDAGLDDG